MIHRGARKRSWAAFGIFVLPALVTCSFTTDLDQYQGAGGNSAKAGASGTPASGSDASGWGASGGAAGDGADADVGCPAGQTRCAGQCTSTDTDAANCGACAHACAPDKVCAAGTCVCPEGMTLCGSTCRDTLNDTANCGTCGLVCPTNAKCKSGSCHCDDYCNLQCPCGDNPLGWCCYNGCADPQHCGLCDKDCVKLGGPACTRCRDWAACSQEDGSSCT